MMVAILVSYAVRLALLFCAAALLSALLYPIRVCAQRTQDPGTRDAERIQEQERERERARRDAFEKSQVRPPSGLEPQPLASAETDEGACAEISRVAIVGMSLFKQADFARELAPLTGGCVTVGRIDSALRAITNRYIASGRITSRAVLGPQSLKEGNLEITVFEGRLERVASTENGYGRAELALAFPGLNGRILNLRDIEQGIDQLSRLQGVEPDIDIQPGSSPATSELLIRRKRTSGSIRPSLSVNDNGSRSTGRWQSVLSVDLDSPLGLADYWSAYFSRDLSPRSTKGSEAYGAFVSFPYGYWALTLSAGRSTYRSTIMGNGQAFASDGRSWNGSATLDRLLFRDSRTKFSLSASLGLLDTSNRIQGIRLSGSSYRLVTGTIGARIERRTPDGLISADLSIVRGFDILGAHTAFTGPDGPGRIFRKLEASLGYQSRIPVGKQSLSYSAFLRGQAALDPVFPAERFSLGGPSTVRGFRDDGISGRYGATFRQQIAADATPLAGGLATALRAKLGVFIAHDLGAIAPRRGDPFERGALQSVALGGRLQTSRLLAELTVAKPLDAPSFVRSPALELSSSVRIGF